MISVIMSVYNSSKYLKESINSVLNQTFSNFEFIIIDDGSDEDTKSILKDYSEQDRRINLIINDTNLGLTKNLNKGIKLAKYDYIARMDSDDISLDDRFAKQFKFLNEHPEIDIVGSYCQDIDEEGNKKGFRILPVDHDEIVKKMVKYNPIIHPSVMFRKSSVIAFGGYNEKYRTTQDYALWFDALSNGLKFHNISENLLLYRVNRNYLDRKSFKYRVNEYQVRKEGYKKNNYISIYLFLPIVLSIFPKRLFWLLKKMDPRNRGEL